MDTTPLPDPPIHLVALVHFCELSGPSIVFVSQPVRRKDITDFTAQSRPDPAPPLDDPPDKCPACHPALPALASGLDAAWHHCTSQFPVIQGCPDTLTTVPISAKPALVSPLSSPSRLLVASARFPLCSDLYPVLKSACVRSLSCEVAPYNRAGGGPLLFTLDGPGYSRPFYIVSHKFNLDDNASRGGVKAFAFLFLTNHGFHVTQFWDTINARFANIVDQLTTLAHNVSIHSNATPSNKLELSPEQYLKKRAKPMSRIKSLVDIVGVNTVFISIHLHFAVLLRDTWITMTTVPDPPPQPHNLENHGSVTTNGIPYKSYSNHPSASRTVKRQPPDPSMSTLYQLFHCMTRRDFLVMVTHLTTGNQVIVRGPRLIVNPVLHGLASILHTDCVSIVSNSPQYRESWECNLLGVDSYVALPLDTLKENGAGYCVVDVDQVTVRVAFEYMPTVMDPGPYLGTDPTVPAPPLVVSRIAVDIVRAMDGLKALSARISAVHSPPSSHVGTPSYTTRNEPMLTNYCPWQITGDGHKLITVHAAFHHRGLPVGIPLGPNVLAILGLAVARIHRSWLLRALNFLRLARVVDSPPAAGSLPNSIFAFNYNPVSSIAMAVCAPESVLATATPSHHSNSQLVAVRPRGTLDRTRPVSEVAKAVVRQASMISISSLLGSSWRRSLTLSSHPKSSTSPVTADAHYLSASPPLRSSKTLNAHNTPSPPFLRAGTFQRGGVDVAGDERTSQTKSSVSPGSYSTATTMSSPRSDPKQLLVCDTCCARSSIPSTRSIPSTPTTPTADWMAEIRFRDEVDVLVLRFWGRAVKRLWRTGVLPPI